MSLKDITDTGERMVPFHHKNHTIYGEHIVRYEAASQLVEGKKVLDIASGSGYGTRLLAETAECVVGIDLDKEALKYSKENYNNKNIQYILGDATKIPLADNTVDVVVSFETIEHILDYKKFLSEIKRVLTDDGLLVLSTPNEEEFPETNEFHVHEFMIEELNKELANKFNFINNYYQGVWLYNAVLNAEDLQVEWRKDINTIQAAPLKASQATYFLVVCSDKKILHNITPVAAIAEPWSARKIQEYEVSIRKHIEDQAKIIDHQKRDINSKDEYIKSLQNHPAFKLIQTTRRLISRLLKK